jgi:hypothetical protein
MRGWSAAGIASRLRRFVLAVAQAVAYLAALLPRLVPLWRDNHDAGAGS